MRILARVAGWVGVLWQAYWLGTHPENGSFVPLAQLCAFALLALISGRLPTRISPGAVIAFTGLAVGYVAFQVVSSSRFGSTPLWAEVSMILALPTVLLGLFVSRQAADMEEWVELTVVEPQPVVQREVK